MCYIIRCTLLMNSFKFLKYSITLFQYLILFFDSKFANPMLSLRKTTFNITHLFPFPYLVYNFKSFLDGAISLLYNNSFENWEIKNVLMVFHQVFRSTQNDRKYIFLLFSFFFFLCFIFIEQNICVLYFVNISTNNMAIEVFPSLLMHLLKYIVWNANSML